MGIEVVGLEGWESVRRLREVLEGVEEKGVLAWGVEREGVFGGERKWRGWEQLEMLEGGGVRVPRWTRDVGMALGWVGEGKEVWGRRVKHSRGVDIVGGVGRKWRGRDYWVMVEEGVREEWRVMVVGGRVVGVGRKVRREKVGSERWGEVVRSRRNGWRLEFGVGEELRRGVRPIAKRAVEVLGYGVGAVDVGLVGEEGEVVVWEVNSAPAVMEGGMLEGVVRGVRRVMGERGGLE